MTGIKPCDRVRRHRRPASRRRRSWSAGLIAATALATVVLAPAAFAEQLSTASGRDCDKSGTWLEPKSGATLSWDRLLTSLAEKPIVLLGEVHDNAEHHRWQLHVLAALHGRNPHLSIGFESFPRRVQPVLDRWVAGELDVEAFLKAAQWRRVWGFDPALYLPLFHFARQNRIPMVALNVDRALVGKVRREGWAAIPADERAGLTDPVPPSVAYQESLARVYRAEQAHRAEAEEKGAPQDADTASPDGEVDLSSVLKSADFRRFVAAQLTWDRAMAEALAEARHEAPESLVVGVIGRGHIEYGHGVPRQLADLGLPEPAILLAVERRAACDGLAAELADAVFVVEAASRIETVPPKARLGVMIEAVEDGVRISKVLDGSVAAATDLTSGDVVVRAAGLPIDKISHLIEIVQRQAPGTWLPITIKRDGKPVEVVAKFPTAFAPPE